MPFRNAEFRDVDALLAQMRHLYEHDGAPFDKQTSRDALLQLMREPQAGVAQIIETGNEVAAGYFVLTFGFSLEYGGRYGLLDELFVDDRFRGTGLGTAAIHRAREICREHGAATLLLEVDQSNKKAIDLYRRLGFNENTRKLMRLKVRNT